MVLNNTIKKEGWECTVFLSPGSGKWLIEMKHHGAWIATFPLSGGFETRAKAMAAAHALLGSKKK